MARCGLFSGIHDLLEDHRLLIAGTWRRPPSGSGICWSATPRPAVRLGAMNLVIHLIIFRQNKREFRTVRFQGMNGVYSGIRRQACGGIGQGFALLSSSCCPVSGLFDARDLIGMKLVSATDRDIFTNAETFFAQAEADLVVSIPLLIVEIPFSAELAP